VNYQINGNGVVINLEKKFFDFSKVYGRFPVIVSNDYPRMSEKNGFLPLPSRTQSLKAAIVFDRDVTVKASSKNELNLQNLIKKQ
jgi:hypothetical protein